MGAKVFQRSPWLVWLRIPKVSLGEFIQCQIRESIDAQLILVTFGIFRLDVVVCGLEVLKPLMALLLGCIILFEFFHKLLELLVYVASCTNDDSTYCDSCG